MGLQLGLGDEIMTSALAREVHEQLGKKLLVAVPASEGWLQLRRSPVWLKNSDFHWLNRCPYPFSRIQRIRPTERAFVVSDASGNRAYIETMTEDRIVFRSGHAVANLCEMHGIKPKALHGKIDIGWREQIWANRRMRSIRQGKKPVFLIEPHVKRSFSADNKDWGFLQWQQTVDLLSSDFKLIQPIYSDKLATLVGVTPVRCPTFRYLCAILQQCDGFLSPEGGIHHAAAALGRHGVVVFGTYISPATTGYDLHTNIYIDDGHAPCGSRRHCPRCQQALSSITPEQVANAARRIAAGDARTK